MTEREIFENTLSHFKIKTKRNNTAQCFCPAHDDKKASLTITMGDKGILFKCHAGCDIDNILRIAGIEKKDIFYDTEPQKEKWITYIESRERKKLETYYNYISPFNGNYLYTKIRLQGKDIKFGTLENNRFTYGLKGRKLKDMKGIYGNLQSIKKAIAEKKPIFLPEGEKDVNTLTKKGYVACTYGSASDWNPELAPFFKGAIIYILADNDEAGIKVATTIYNDLKEIAKNGKIILPVPDIPHADITDYFNAKHTKEEFEQLLQQEQNTVKEKNMESLQLPAQAQQEQVTITKIVENDPLRQFHHFNGKDQSKPTGVFDFAIFKYFKENYHVFICGSPYLYTDGVYIRDANGTKIKKIIRDCLYEQFKKSRIINQVYNLIFEAEEFQLDFSEVNQYQKSWINFQDCMLDVNTMQKMPHDPKYFSINQVPYCYKDIEKAPKGKEIEQFLNSMIPDKDDRKMFLEFSGLAKTTDTSFQKFLVLLGAAGNGKSVLIRLIEASTGKMNTSNVAMQNLEKRFATSNLVGKTLNACADLSEDAMEDCSNIKQIVGEDSLMAERKGENAFSFKSYTKLVFSTNMLPMVKNEKTAGFYRRMLVLKINKPTIQDSDVDINFFEKLENEILYFCKISIDALHEAYQRGTITISENSKKAVNQLRKDSDVVQAWIDDCCITKEDLRIERTVAYENFKKYCEEEERQSLTRNGFFKTLRTKNYIEAIIKGYRYFKGLNLNENCTPNIKKTAPNEFIEISKKELEKLPFK
ncbi:MAG: phage/plasmid primase, P4 family [Clostridia bacterium]|nr:phage/plasmid primase, P4 family [Clostridia bacterium]